MNRIKSLALNITLSFTTLTVLFLIIEFVMSYGTSQLKTKSALPEGLFNQSSISYLSPGFKGEFNNKEIAAEIIINSKGIRDKELNYEKSGTEFRILGLGDSFTFSYTSYEGNFLTMLEYRLNSQFKKQINVIKAGVPGTGPDFYYNFYNNEGYKYNPDIILINFYIGNDVTNIGEMSSFSSNKETLIEVNYFYKLKVWLRNNSKFYNFVVDRIKGIPAVKKKLNDQGIAPDVFEVYNQNPDKNLEIKWKKLEVILEKFKKSKKKIVVVIIPSIYQIDKKSEKTLMSTRINNNYNVNYPTKRLKKLLLKMNIDFINPLNSLKKLNYKKDILYKTEGHFNSSANKVLADEIFQYLTKNSTLK